MSVQKNVWRKDSRGESGAALITAILVSLLLGTACVAMLTAVGANSKNNTDALSEYKAYYAAESGLQASINVLRNTSGIKYSDAVADPDLSTWIGSGSVGSEATYTVAVTDPDNSAGAIIYSTAGTFQQADGTYASMRVYGSGPDTLTFSFINQTSRTANHPINDGQPFGSLQVVKAGAGATMSADLNFHIDYIMSDPRPATRTIRGTIKTTGEINFVEPRYGLMGSTITLCKSNAGCPAPPLDPFVIPPTDALPQTAAVYATMTAIQPYRLKVLATGHGPNNSTKQLEAVIQRNFFNDLSSSAAIAMIGPNASFQVGSSAKMMIDGGSVPSVTVSDLTSLNAVNYAQAHTSGTMVPAPEIAGNDVPDWQRSTTAMNNFVSQLKQAAQNSGRYFSSRGPTSFGDYSAGTGITFCDRNCSMGGNTQGGGILVVTGTFSTSGSPRFKGLILAVGPGGVVRSGGGNEIFTGNIVIAPYDPNNLGAGWGQPIYNQSGGPGDTINSDVTVDQAFDGTSAITDFMLGVAEK